MLSRMKNILNHSRGFSLVELVVVVLIIAIIAVALAPQVMKYVRTASINTDINNAGNIKSAALAGAAYYVASGHDLSSAETIAVKEGESLAAAPGAGTLEEAVFSDMGLSTTEAAPKIQSDSSMNFWVIKITDQGHVVTVFASSTRDADGKSSVIVA